jgi:Fe-S-cluster containining protein
MEETMKSFDFIRYHDQLRDSLTSTLSEVKSRGDLCVVMTGLTDLLEVELAKHLTVEDHELLACAAGCGSCCMVNVSVLDPEAVNIARYLKGQLSDIERETLLLSMKKMVNAISDVDEEERIAMRRSCTFLSDKGECTIYPVRPLLCRSITSTSATACRDALAMQALGEQLPVVMNLFQKNLFDVGYQGLAKAMENNDMDSHGAELTAAVLQHMNDGLAKKN